MRLGGLAGAFKKVRLGRVIGGKVSLARNDVMTRRRRRDLPGVVETLAGLARDNRRPRAS
jgi:hypothetical protein